MDPERGSRSNINYNAVDGDGQRVKRNRGVWAVVIALLLVAGAVIALALKLYSDNKDLRARARQPQGSGDPAADTRAQANKFVYAAIDKSVDPCDDFYSYACNGWAKTHSISPDKSAIYLVIDAIQDANQAVLREILESQLDWPWIGKFYAQCNDTAAINAAGYEPIKPLMADIDSLENDPRQYAAITARMQKAGVNALFAFSSGPDLETPADTIAQLGQAGTALGDPAFYSDQSKEGTKARDTYVKHIETQLKNAGVSDGEAEGEALAALALETKLAAISLTPLQQRDINATYNKMTVGDLRERITPISAGLDLLAYFKAVNADWDEDAIDAMVVNVADVKYFIKLSQLMSDLDKADFQAYLRWQLITSAAPYLSENFQNAQFDFFSKFMRGVETRQPLWERCVAQTDAQLGSVLGRYYILKDFSQAAKQTVTEMMQSLLASMRLKIEAVEWMDAATKKRAEAKLDLFREQIGYPNVWEELSGLDLTHASHYADVQSIAGHAFRKMVSSIGKPTDRNQFSMTTPTVNAYYDPTTNQIVVPAGILQGFYFNELYHPAINYGGTGGTQGHEMTHGFDDQGAQYDGTGKFVNWWSPETLKKWNERTRCLADFYSGFEIMKHDGQPFAPPLFINGNLTNGENIADCGGIKQAFNAYQSYMKKHDTIPGTKIATSEPYIEGMDNDKLFFVAYAQGWCYQASDAQSKFSQKNDVHSPGPARVNGPLMQSRDFGRVFGCKQGQDKMFPKDVCDVW